MAMKASRRPDLKRLRKESVSLLARLQTPNTTLSDPLTCSGMFSQMMVKTLYRSGELGTLARGDRSHGDGARAAPDSLARPVSALLRPSRAAARPAGGRAWRVQPQPSGVDAGEGGPRHR